MAITTLNLRALNRSDTATSGQVITATSATAADFQDAAVAQKVIDKASAFSKLEALGLSSSEIDALSK